MIYHHLTKVCGSGSQSCGDLIGILILLGVVLLDVLGLLQSPVSVSEFPPSRIYWILILSN